MEDAVLFGEEAVLDRLPTARISDEEDGVYTTAEVFGKRGEIWVRSQGDSISDVTVH